jgi:cellobiose phosphorylase
VNYGHFDDAHHEYIITDSHTPVKWINYIGTLAFDGFVDHTGGAIICKSDPTFNRTTKYLQQMPSSDFRSLAWKMRRYDG